VRLIKLQKRSIFNRIFGTQPQTPQQLTAVQMLNSYNNRISNYSGDLYDNATVRSCIDTIARYFAKMQPVHRLKGVTVNDSLNALISLRPNVDMSTYTFLYKVATCYYMDNNVYLYISRDSLGNVISLWPFSYSQAELKENKYGDLYLEFTFSTGKKVVASTDDVIILRRNIYKNDFFSETNNKPLYPIVNLLYTISQGIINAVKSSAFIRGIYKVIGGLQPADIKEKRDNFKSQFFDTQNNGGIIVMDSKGEYTPIDSKPVLVDDKNSKLVNEQVYTYFGINENIVKGTYTEDEFTAFYEGILEPLALQLSQEMNAKLFSQREIGFGNEVVFVGDKLSYMSMTSKVNMINAVKDLGVLTKGTIADILNIERPADADKILQSLNYIDTSIANQYQLQAQKDKLSGVTQTAEGGETQDDESSKGNSDESDPDQSGTE
jgi:HK97 family phage portal protein